MYHFATRIADKILKNAIRLMVVVASVFSVACANEFSFNEVSTTCEPPPSSARFGKNKGPVIVSPEAYSPYNSSATVAGTCEGDLSLTISGSGIKDSVTTNCSNGRFSASVNFKSGDGSKEVDVTQLTADNGSEISDRRCFTLDTIPPKVVITGTSGAQSVNRTTIQIEGSCEPGLDVSISGPQLVSPALTSCNNSRFSTSITFTGTDGLKDVLAIQVDRAGNRGDDDQQYLTDLTPPRVTINSPAALFLTRGNLTVTGSCEVGPRVVLQGQISPALATADCINGTYSANVILASPDGVKNVTATQTDLAGNSGSANRDFRIDTTPPPVTIDSPAANSPWKDGLTLQGACETGLQVAISGAGVNTPSTTSCANGRYSTNILFSDNFGSKEVVASQTDAIGNTGSASRSFLRQNPDVTAPVVRINSPAAGTVAQSGITLAGVCESGLTVNISGSGATATSTSCSSGNFSTFVNFSSGDGIKNIIASQTDLSGNIGSDNRDFARDTTGPLVRITSPAANTSATSGVTLIGTCETGLSVTISGAVSAVVTTACNAGSFSALTLFSSGNGTKNLVATQTDALGNVGSDNRNFNRVNNAGFDSFISKGPGGKVDILFVDDNSVSMDPEQAALGNKFSSFTASLSTADWQVGIITTDCSNGSPFNFCGQLFDFAGLPSNQYILTPLIPNFLDAFKNTIQRPETIDCRNAGLCPSGTEEGLKSTISAFNQRNTANAGFFRNDADLAVVYLSDEDERSNAPPAATTPSEVINAFNSIWGTTNKKFSAYGIIIQPGDSACLSAQQQQTGGQANYGTYVDQLASLTNGLTVSVCAADYSLTLKEIADNVTRLSSALDLTNAPIAGTVTVNFTPAHSTRFTVSGKRIIFETPAPLGTLVEISYSY